MASIINILTIGSSVFVLIDKKLYSYHNSRLDVNKETENIGIYKYSASNTAIDYTLEKPKICFGLPVNTFKSEKTTAFYISIKKPTPFELLAYPERYNHWGEHYFSILLYLFGISIVANLAEC